MASSKDVRDILNLPASATPHPPSMSSRPTGSAPRPKPVKRPDGISRELFALMGGNAPALALGQPQKPQFKERYKRAGPAVKWELTKFTIPSRRLKEGDKGYGEKEDLARAGLVLSHWVRDRPQQQQSTPQPTADSVKDGEVKADPKFEKFNTTSGALSYSDTEYEQLLKDDDWSREETDYLFTLAHSLDLRFVVIHDRWQHQKERSVDELKARYYSVARRLVRSRPAENEERRAATLANLNFDLAREVERKKYLRSLLSRTPAQIAEEDFLYIESRRLEQSYNKMASERAELLRILGGREGIGASPGMQLGVGGGVKGLQQPGQGGREGSAGAQQKGKKLGAGYELEGLNGGGLPEGWAGEGSKRKATPQQDAANCIERHPAPSVSATKALPYPSVSVRSSRIAQPKPAVLNKVAAAITELGISTHLVMPTKQNVEKLDLLQAALGTMVELKKATDRIEAEVRVATKRKEALLEAKREREGSKAEERAEEEGAPAEEGTQRTKRSGSVTSNTSNKRARRE